MIHRLPLNRLGVSLFIGLFFSALYVIPSESFLADDVLRLKTCSAAVISPDGQWIAYTVSVPRQPNEESGRAWSELQVVSIRSGLSRPFISGQVNAISPQWSPDGSNIAFLSPRGQGGHTQVWLIALAGGEAVQLTRSESDIETFHWHPDGSRIAYTAPEAESKREKELEKRGYGFTFYEENLKPHNLYLISSDPLGVKKEPEKLTTDLQVWDFTFSPDGRAVALLGSGKNLVDQEYMFKKIYLLDLQSKKLELQLDPQKKVGNISFSPDGRRLAYTAALEQCDHAVSQVYVLNLSDKTSLNLTPVDFAGHITWAGWRNSKTIGYLAEQGVWNNLWTVNVAGRDRAILLESKRAGVVFSDPNYFKDFTPLAFIGSTASIPSDVYFWNGSSPLKRLTQLNPWLIEKKLAKQEVVQYRARDQALIEGLLIYPVSYQSGQRYPLVVMVHGGPESHHSNDWKTSYSTPGQVLAEQGYLVFFPNYRSSTGYGVSFALTGYGDPAGKEFDDIADGIEYLVSSGLADGERVGLGGGSYGGYAAAWFASYYTRLVRAVVMFVGISDLISKRLTTDIPYEELYVHSGKAIEEMWDLELKRSPVYWAHLSQTAVLILGGTADSRVDPSQSKEFYRVLKMNHHPAVRLVQYPGEGHGNRKQPGRIDVLYRTLQWFDWYVKDKKPLDGDLPPLDISDCYGLKLD